MVFCWIISLLVHWLCAASNDYLFFFHGCMVLLLDHWFFRWLLVFWGRLLRLFLFFCHGWMIFLLAYGLFHWLFLFFGRLLVFVSWINGLFAWSLVCSSILIFFVVDYLCFHGWMVFVCWIIGAFNGHLFFL